MGGSAFDVAVVGTGPVGLAAALALARTGAETCLVGPRPGAPDGRTAALLAPSVALLDTLGIWPDLLPEAGALRTMRIVDDTGSLFRPPPVSFEAREIGLDAFGWNIENGTLARLLAEAVAREPRVSWRESLAEAFAPGDPARLSLADGSALEARLVVAADGRRSRVRADAGIKAREHAYRQSAFTAILEHERDHDDVSTEFHTRSGPFTLVPLPGRRSSLVWVTSPPHAARLMSSGDDAVAEAIGQASQAILGRVRVAGPKGTVPLVAMSVDRLTGERVALAGEAAHVLPPIGAQGLNLGFADVAALAASVEEATRRGEDPGGEATLARYGRARSRDTRLRSMAVDGLNRTLMSDVPLLDAARGLGMSLLGGVGPLRRALMRAGFPGATITGRTASAGSRPS